MCRCRKSISPVACRCPRDKMLGDGVRTADGRDVDGAQSPTTNAPESESSFRLRTQTGRNQSNLWGRVRVPFPCQLEHEKGNENSGVVCSNRALTAASGWRRCCALLHTINSQKSGLEREGENKRGVRIFPSFPDFNSPKHFLSVLSLSFICRLCTPSAWGSNGEMATRGSRV